MGNLLLDYYFWAKFESPVLLYLRRVHYLLQLSTTGYSHKKQKRAMRPQASEEDASVLKLGPGKRGRILHVLPAHGLKGTRATQTSRALNAF